MIGLSQYNKDCAGIYGVPANIITYFIKHKTLMFYHKHYLQRLCTGVVSSFKKGAFKHSAGSFSVQVLHKQVQSSNNNHTGLVFNYYVNKLSIQVLCK